MIDWIEVLKRSSLFGDNLRFFGKSFLNLSIAVSVLFFWFIIFNFYEPYRQIAVFMIKLIQIGILLLVMGYFVHYIFYFITELNIKKKMKRVKLKVK